MTSQSPRIYTYKITFLEVPYYYYGVHKEKKFDEKYFGTPVSHKWCWEIYTPKKQILQLFDFTDEGWLEAQEVEKRLIKPVFNTDKWCLNEHCGGKFSLELCRKNGELIYKMGVGIYSITTEERKSRKLGIFSLTREQLSETAKKTYNEGKGCCALSTKERIERGRKNYEMKVGIHALTPEETLKNAKKGGNKAKELGVGFHGRSKEEIIEYGRMGGLKGGKTTSSQKWVCLETGFVANAGNLAKYQRARGIDTSKRKRIEWDTP